MIYFLISACVVSIAVCSLAIISAVYDVYHAVNKAVEELRNLREQL